jgi:hypothetical protein
MNFRGGGNKPGGNHRAPAPTPLRSAATSNWVAMSLAPVSGTPGGPAARAPIPAAAILGGPTVLAAYAAGCPLRMMRALESACPNNLPEGLSAWVQQNACARAHPVYIISLVVSTPPKVPWTIVTDRLCVHIRELFEKVLPPGWQDVIDHAKEEAGKVFFVTKKGSVPWEPSEPKPFTDETRNQAALRYARILFHPLADLLSSCVEDPDQLKIYLELAIRLVSVEAFERAGLYRPLRGSFVYGDTPEQWLRIFEANVTAMLTRRVRSLIRAARKRKKEQAVTLGAAERMMGNPAPQAQSLNREIQPAGLFRKGGGI